MHLYINQLLEDLEEVAAQPVTNFKPRRFSKPSGFKIEKWNRSLLFKNH
jgi:hypothetical protein